MIFRIPVCTVMCVILLWLSLAGSVRSHSFTDKWVVLLILVTHGFAKLSLRYTSPTEWTWDTRTKALGLSCSSKVDFLRRRITSAFYCLMFVPSGPWATVTNPCFLNLSRNSVQIWITNDRRYCEFESQMIFPFVNNSSSAPFVKRF